MASVFFGFKSYKVTNNISIAWGGSVVVYDGDYWYNGYVWSTEGGSLFDVNKDPRLTKDIILEAPDKAEELLKLCWEDAREPVDMKFMRKFKDLLGCTPVTKTLTKQDKNESNSSETFK